MRSFCELSAHTEMSKPGAFCDTKRLFPLWSQRKFMPFETSKGINFETVHVTEATSTSVLLFRITGSLG